VCVLPKHYTVQYRKRRSPAFQLVIRSGRYNGFGDSVAHMQSTVAACNTRSVAYVRALSTTSPSPAQISSSFSPPPRERNRLMATSSVSSHCHQFFALLTFREALVILNFSSYRHRLQHSCAPSAGVTALGPFDLPQPREDSARPGHWLVRPRLALCLGSFSNSFSRPLSSAVCSLADATLLATRNSASLTQCSC
jgi:hypothetical protein